MKTQAIYQGRTYKEVTIETDTEAEGIDRDLLIGYAMSVAGESPTSVFGTGVTFPWQFSKVAVVTLYTD